MNFFPLSWSETKQYIEAYGWAEDGAYCCLFIEGFTPFIYVKNASESQVRGVLSRKRISWEKTAEVRRRGLYSNVFRGLEQYCFVAFKNTYIRAAAVKALNGASFQVCENKASAVLQMTCTRDINQADWFRAMVSVEETERVTRCDREYKIHWKEIFPCEHKPTAIPKPVVMAYDIETFAHDVNIFPDPKDPRDVVFQISIIVSVSSDVARNKRMKILLTLGTPMFDLLDEDVEVYTFKSEAKMLLHYAELVRQHSPQILIGYNTFGFDNNYMIERAKYFMIFDDFSRQGYTHEKSKVFSSTWSSSAYNNQELYYLDLKGRLHIDMMIFVKREYKLDSYSLNSVAMHFLGAKKDPLNHYHIRSCYLKGMENPDAESKALSYVGTYCVKDSVLVLDLYDKLKMWEAVASMATVCNTSVVDLFAHGQTKKIFCQVYRFCVSNNIVVENDSYRARADEVVEGAVVMEPKVGLYHNVVSFDFASLYPSIIISHNIDFGTLVQPEDKVDDADCHVVEWESHMGCECEGADKAKKMRDGTKITVCKAYRVRWLREPMGVIPTIIQGLLGARKETRKRMQSLTEGNSEWTLLNQQQLAYKISANSMFGAYASRFGQLQFLIAGMSVTAIGRQSIRRVREIMEKEHAAEVIYGDSVPAYTPVLIKKNGIIRYMRIDEIPVKWKIGEDGKQRGQPKGYEVWSDKQWTRIKYVMKHATRKRLIQITSYSGCVTVTEDHSLLRPNGDVCSPNDVKVGETLLHANLPTLPENKSNITYDKAYKRGVFYAKFKHDIPNNIINSNSEVRRGFIHGYFEGEMTTNEVLAANIRLLLESLGYTAHIDQMNNSTAIRTIQVVSEGEEQLVYDLETENHHFAAGIGRLIVHNTDSAYVKVRSDLPPKQLHEHCLQISDQVSAHFPRPMKLDFEGKIYELYFLLTKKRYILRLLGASDLKVAGVLLKRRDNSLIVKEAYKDLVNCCLRHASEDELWAHFYQNMAVVLAGYRRAEEYAIGRSVKTIDSFEIRPRSEQKVYFGCYIISKFSSDEKKRRAQLKKKGAMDELDFCYKSLPNHVQLALKMRARGQTIQNGSRLSFLYIKGDKRALTVEKMEDLEFFELFYDNSAIDTAEYLRLLCERPLSELFNVYLKGDYTKFFTNVWKVAAARNAVNDEYKKLLKHKITFE